MVAFRVALGVGISVACMSAGFAQSLAFASGMRAADERTIVRSKAQVDHEGVAAEISGLLASMSAAVLAKDADGFIALLDDRDAPFLRESGNWMKDAIKNPPATFVMSLDAKHGIVQLVDVNTVLAGVNMKWAMPTEAHSKDGNGANKTKRARAIGFLARFTRIGQDSAWKYAGEHWDVIELAGDGAFQGARVLIEPTSELAENESAGVGAGGSSKQAETSATPQGEAKTDKLPALAEQIVNYMPEIRKRVDEFFGAKVSGVVTIKLYRSMKHLQASIWLSYEDSLSGWNEPGESIKLLNDGRSASAMRVVLAHEYGHVASFTLGPKATDGPWWMLEGVAELAGDLFSPRGVTRRKARLKQWHSAGNLAPWDAIAPFPLKPEDEKWHPHVYHQGAHMMGFIAERYSHEQMLDFFRQMASGKTVDQSSRAALGLAFADVDAAWKLSLDVAGAEGKDEPAPGNDAK